MESVTSVHGEVRYRTYVQQESIVGLESSARSALTDISLTRLAMLTFSKAVLCAVLLGGFANAAPASSGSALASSVSASPAAHRSPSSTSSAPQASSTVPYASDDPNGVLWSEDSTTNPQAIREGLGATVIGPQNVPIALQNPDLLAPPSTDSGNM